MMSGAYNSLYLYCISLSKTSRRQWGGERARDSSKDKQTSKEHPQKYVSTNECLYMLLSNCFCHNKYDTNLSHLILYPGHQPLPKEKDKINWTITSCHKKLKRTYGCFRKVGKMS